MLRSVPPWYVLGPGHRWPLALIPFYRLLETVPGKRESALRLGLVTIQEMVAALAWAVENPPAGACYFCAGDSFSLRLRVFALAGMAALQLLPLLLGKYQL